MWSNTARRISAWSLLETRVVSAHRYSARGVLGRATVTAAANRSHRPGPTGRPAARRAAPNRAVTSARSSAAPTGGATPSADASGGATRSADPPSGATPSADPPGRATPSADRPGRATPSAAPRPGPPWLGRSVMLADQRGEAGPPHRRDVL